MARPVGPPSVPRRVTKVGGRARNLERRFTRPRTQQVVIDGIGSEITPGVKGEIAIHFDCQITGWSLLADQAGDIVIDIWKTDYAGYPPTIADTITAGDQPTLSGADKAEDATLSGWTVDVNAGDTFRFNVDSVSTVTRVVLNLKLIA
jgi:hypothetical protein